VAGIRPAALAEEPGEGDGEDGNSEHHEEQPKPLTPGERRPASREG
jgi:hypothetical protein